MEHPNLKVMCQTGQGDQMQQQIIEGHRKPLQSLLQSKVATTTNQKPPLKSLLPSKEDTNQQRTGTQNLHVELTSKTSAQCVVDLTDNSDGQVDSQTVQVVEGHSKPGNLEVETDQGFGISAEKQNRFYKFCSINDPRNPSFLLKNESKPSEPVTPVLFNENSQEEGLLKEESNLQPDVSTTQKLMFRKEKSQRRSVETLPTVDDENDFRNTSMDKSLNSSHVEKGTSEKQEECHLKTRRGPRGIKRTSTSKPNLRMSQKVVEFEDESKENQTQKPSYFSCKSCGQRLIDAVVDYEQRKKIPKFLETVQSFKNKAVIFMSDGELGSSCQPCTAKSGGVPLNSLWSEEEGCCTQFISCTGCHKSQAHPVIGAQIVCVDKPSSGLQKGQM